MTRGSSNSSIRKALGSIKDTTTISLAKVSSEYKELDIAIVKATNHVERPAKERHIRAIFAAVSSARPRADVAYCIHTISRRLLKTRNWAVALKTLIVIHRALREADPSFHEELINYGRRGGHVLNMSHFKDDSSAYAWDFSAWIRCYALYLEERLECFRVLKYDVETDRPKTKDLDIADLLQQIPSLQQLLSRALACQLEGATTNNTVIRLALSLVASESMKIYDAISDGILNLVEKFFKMQHQDAIRALEIYKRVVQQAERLSLFHEVCMSLNIRGERFIKIEQPPPSLLQAMEDYVRVAQRGATFRKEQAKQVIEKKDTPKDILTIEDTKDVESKQGYPTLHPDAEPIKAEKDVAKSLDLLSLDCGAPVVQEQDEKNALALTVVPACDESTAKAPPPRRDNGIAGWELALVAAPTSKEPATMPDKPAGGFDKLILDNLYDEAIRKTSQPAASCNPWEATPTTHRMMQQPPPHDPFFASRLMAPPPPLPMTTQQQAFMQQQQHMMMAHQHQHQPTMNAYGAAPYGPGMPMHQAYNPYAGMY